MFPKGPFSWCPATLDDMPIDLRVDLESQAARRARLLRVENGGAVVGTWHYELVTALQVKKNQVQPHGDHISVAVVFHNALLEWQNCLILRERKTDNGLALLVTTVGLTVEDAKVLLECNYVGAARIAKDEDEKPSARTIITEFHFRRRRKCVLAWNRGDLNVEQKAAETVYSEALSALERDLGKDHAIVIITAKMLASVLLNKGDIAAAEEILSNILPHLQRLAGPSHLTLTTRYDLSRAHVSQRRITVPGPMLTLMEDIQGYLGQEHWLTRLTAFTTAGFYFMKKEHASAVPLLESAKQRCTTQDTPQEFLAACAKRDLGMVYSMLAGLRDYVALIHLETREIVGKLGRLYAKPLLRSSHEVPISHVYRAVYGLKELLERYGDVPGSKGRVKWALPDYKTEFGIDSNDTGERVSPGVNNGDTYLEENEILVQNKAIALRDDLDSIEDNGSDSEEYDELGEASDVSGVVVRVGSREGPFKEGDRVMGQVVYASTKAQRHAGRQHYTVLLTHMTAQIPRTLSFDRAAALPSSASAAAAALFSKSHLGLDLPSVPFKPPGDKFVLVLGGGTTSVGCSAVQLAVAAGFRVIATALPKDFDYTHGIGATLLVDCSSPTLVDDLTQELSGKQVVGAINTIGSQGKMDIYGMDVVAAHDIEAVNIKDDDDLSRRIYGFLHIALAEGRYVCAPDPGVNLTTTAVQASLEAHRKVIIAL
ncbi:hypothetical protein N7519_007747 [Penicillium mononematosum]|uniref:uncharacterized protein n=1 Tax=Penicillium mononematosum TaxID=268346 RepID=UPI002547E41B|nr:uncharacterized protein N7519_007747 [Penicillium mononematosum]KAJ6186446.1 hypothetical protein N7519_007747 [Penicillium mononematosum]